MAAAFILIAILLIMAAAAASASASPPRMAKLAAPGVRELPAGAELPRSAISELESASPDASGASGAEAASTSIFFDGFEGASPPWTVGGDPTWAVTMYRTAVGARSAYCAGSGIYPPGPYANGMNAWLIAGPFDLSGVTSATVAFKLYLKTELNYDGVYSLVSIDGQHYYGPAGVSGDSQGWIDRSLDLTAVEGLGSVCGRGQVWIAFNFTSDGSGTDEGAYVDEVRVTGAGGQSGVAALTLFASAATVDYGGEVTLSGELKDAVSGALLSGREVEWWWSQSYEIPMSWTNGGAESAGTGAYFLSIVNITRRTYFITRFGGDAQYPDNCWSEGFVKVMARAKLTSPAVPSRVRAGTLVKSSGTLMPLHTSAQNKSSHTKVYLERYSRGKWRSVWIGFAQSYSNTSSATKYSFGLRYASGKWRVRAVHQDSDHAKTTSSWRYFTAY